MQDDFVVVVSREELLEGLTLSCGQGVKASIRVDLNQHWHSGCVGHQ